MGNIRLKAYRANDRRKKEIQQNMQDNRRDDFVKYLKATYS